MNNMVMNKQGGRNHAVDLMKLFAAILITNSHMQEVYPARFAHLAFGGAIGDALFFFCSGFLLMLGGSDDFFNWYKRRINRIIPAVFSVALISIVFFKHDPTLRNVIVNGGGWFVRAIFLFYAIFWFVKKYLYDKLWIAFVINTAIILICFLFLWDYDNFILVGTQYMRLPVFFLVMLFGAAISKRLTLSEQPAEQKRSSLLAWFLIFVTSVMFYYVYIYLQNRFPILKYLQLLLVPVLMVIVYAFYRFCSCSNVIKVFCNKYLHWLLYGISACCLEIYLTGGWMFGLGSKLSHMFPLNIIITFILIFIVAYLAKIFSNFLSQTFKTEKYDWKGMIRL